MIIISNIIYYYSDCGDLGVIVYRTSGQQLLWDYKVAYY
jgi:hypothetical protein